MTEIYYKTRNYSIDHTTFGGLINLSDFNTDNRGKRNSNGSPIAKQIESDNKFDKQCKTNAEYRNRNKNWRNSNA